MKTNYLLPNKFKKPGWVLLMLGLAAGFFIYHFSYQPDFLERSVLSIYEYDYDDNTRKIKFSILENNIADEIAMVMVLLGAFLVGFTKEKQEDEFIYKLRTDSLVWAIILNSVILMFAIIFVYDFSFIDMMVYNMFTPLLFFVARFNFMKFKMRSHEE